MPLAASTPVQVRQAESAAAEAAAAVEEELFSLRMQLERAQQAQVAVADEAAAAAGECARAPGSVRGVTRQREMQRAAAGAAGTSR